MEDVKTLIKFGFIGMLLILVLDYIFRFLHLNRYIALFLASFITAFISYKHGKNKFIFSLLQSLSIFIIYTICVILNIAFFLLFIKEKDGSPYFMATLILNSIMYTVFLIYTFSYLFLGSTAAFLLKRIREPKVTKKDKQRFQRFFSIILVVIFINLLLSLIPLKLIPESEEDCLWVQRLIRNESSVSKCYHNLAVRTKNETYCSKISLTYGFGGEKSQEYCYAAVARVAEKHKICEKAFDRIECYAFLARGLNDSSVCNNNLEVEDDKKLCIEKFIEKSKVKYVGKGLPRVLTEEACEAQTNLGLKTECYSNLAAEQKNESFCEKIIMPNDYETQKERAFCYTVLAVDQKNESFCEKIKTDKSFCYTEVARREKEK